MNGLSLLYYAILLELVHSFIPQYAGRSPFNVKQTQLRGGTADYLETVREGIVQAGFDEAWEASVALLSETTDMDKEEAEECLAKAWQWKNWAVCSSSIARKYIKTIKPNAAAIATSLNWLQSGPLGLDQNILRAGILSSPEAYLLSPEENYNQILKVAPKKWKDPADFKALLLEEPEVLQLTYNCADEGCNSNCGNCWVTFENCR